MTFSCVEIREKRRINYPKSKPHFSPWIERRKPEFLGTIVGIRGPRTYVGPWALSEDTLRFEDRYTVMNM